MNTKPQPIGITPHFWTTEEVRDCIAESEVVVFAKGTQLNPRCGFSKELLSVVEEAGRPYRVIDVCAEPSVLPALGVYQGQRYLPSVYLNGELLGSGMDLGRLLSSGKIQEKLKQSQS